MNIPKAIEILSITLAVKGQLGKDDEHDAIKLGIEALKRHAALRSLYPYGVAGLLPGETQGD